MIYLNVKILMTSTNNNNNITNKIMFKKTNLQINPTNIINNTNSSNNSPIPHKLFKTGKDLTIIVTWKTSKPN